MGQIFSEPESNLRGDLGRQREGGAEFRRCGLDGDVDLRRDRGRHGHHEPEVQGHGRAGLCAGGGGESEQSGAVNQAQGGLAESVTRRLYAEAADYTSSFPFTLLN